MMYNIKWWLFSTFNNTLGGTKNSGKVQLANALPFIDMVYLPPHPQEKDVNGELNELHFSTHFEISSNFLTETVFAPIPIRPP